MIDDTLAVNLLWKEFEVRLTHYWQSLNRFSLTIITISVVPYLKPELATKLGRLVLIFPTTALLVTAGATWLLAAEYQRLRAVKQRFDAIMPKQYQRDPLPETTTIQKVLKLRVGIAATLLFGLGFTLLCLINFVLLMTERSWN